MGLHDSAGHSARALCAHEPARCCLRPLLSNFSLCADEDPVAQAFVQRRASLTQEQWDTFLSVKVLSPCRFPTRLACH